jgi:Protein of unknown function (DUF2510)
MRGKPLSTTPAGWLADSSGRHQYRYWDGTRWTDHIAAGLDPLATPSNPSTPERSSSAALPTTGGAAPASAISSDEPPMNRLNELLDACLCGRIQENTAELFALTQARPASVAPDQSVWAKFTSFIDVAESCDQKLTSVKMSQFAIFWHTSAYQESADTIQFYLGRASPEQLRTIRLNALACCKDLDPATGVIRGSSRIGTEIGAKA